MTQLVEINSLMWFQKSPPKCKYVLYGIADNLTLKPRLVHTWNSWWKSKWMGFRSANNGENIKSNLRERTWTRNVYDYHNCLIYCSWLRIWKNGITFRRVGKIKLIMIHVVTGYTDVIGCPSRQLHRRLIRGGVWPFQEPLLSDCTFRSTNE